MSRETASSALDALEVLGFIACILTRRAKAERTRFALALNDVPVQW